MTENTQAWMEMDDKSFTVTEIELGDITVQDADGNEYYGRISFSKSCGRTPMSRFTFTDNEGTTWSYLRVGFIRKAGFAGKFSGKNWNK